MIQKTAKGETDSTANKSLRLWLGEDEAKRDYKRGNQGPVVGQDWYSFIMWVEK